MLSHKYYEIFTRWILLFVLSFLLTTNNFSVFFIILFVLLSVAYLYTNRHICTFSKFDLAITFCLSIYFIGAIPIAIYDGTTARYFQGGIRLILCLPIYLSLKTCIENSELKIKSSLDIGLILGSIGAFIISFYQYFILHMPRVDGFLFSINFGYLACTLAFLAFTFSFNSKRKPFLLLGSALCTLAVIFTNTRGAIFAIPLMLALLVTINFNNINKKYILVGTLSFLLVSTVLYNTSENFKSRIDYTVHELTLIASGDIEKSTSSGYRLHYWYGAMEAFKVSPLIGLPYHEREKLNHQLYLDEKIGEGASIISRGHAHNQYFEMMASNGVIGILSVVGIFIIPFFIFVSHYLKHKSHWSLSASIFVFGFIIFGLTEVPLTANLIGSFYGFMLAVFFAIIAAERQGKRVL
ncbi:ligase [Vibrio tubiashii]|nr:ligase [Vibrio tubiashii]